MNKLGHGILDLRATPSDPAGPRITQMPPSGGVGYPDSGVQSREAMLRSAPVSGESRTRYNQQKAENVAWLTAGFSHDLNNLLVGVLGNADLAQAALLRGEDPMAHLKAIRAAAERAAELTSSMLRFASNRQQPASVVDLARLVGETVMIARAGVGRVIQVIEPTPSAPTNESLVPHSCPIRVMGEAGRVSQVLLNLIINGADSLGAKGGEVNIELGTVAELPSGLVERPVVVCERGYAKVSVSDTGSGIDDETLAHMFEPFFSTKERGQGLGLATTLSIVRDYSGALAVTSQVSVGTTFDVYLPLHTGVEQDPFRSAADADGPSAVPSWRTSGKVLVVDDEPMVARLTAMVLEHLGMEPHIERSGLAVLDNVKQCHQLGQPFRLVVVDWTMPDLSGLEVLRLLRTEYPSLPVIVTSGFTEQRITADWTPDDHSGFLQKPYRMTAVIDLLKSVFDEA